MSRKKSSDPLLDAALALPRSEVSRLKFHPLMARRICRTALNVLERHRETLASDYPGFVLEEFDALPELCIRVGELQYHANRSTRATVGELAKRTPQVFAYRRELLNIARSFAARGLVDRKTVTRISKGRGKVDNLTDVLDLVLLLTPHKAKVELILERGVLTAAKTAADEALSLIGVGRGPDDAMLETADLRDRYATLVERRYDRLRVALAAVLGLREALKKTRSIGRETR